MTTFRTRITKLSKEKGRIILANDYDLAVKDLEKKTIQNIKTLHNYLCGLKLNFHLLLPLGLNELKRINSTAHKFGLQTIADIKLNDIGNTNKITSKIIWNCGFDSVIVNPIMGPKSLKNLVNLSHKKSKGVIALCHMSAPEAKLSYESKIKSSNMELYKLFLKWALQKKTDGIIVGATYPEIIKYCKKHAGKKLDIYSPGIGTQGGNVQKAILAGSDFLIVGRSILDSKNPLKVAKSLSQLSF